MAKPKLRVCFVDDDRALCKSLQLAAKTIGFDSIIFGSAQEFLTGFDPTGVFCIVLEAHLQGMSGLVLLEILRARNTPIPVIFLTGHGDIALAVQVLKNGAQDVLEKPFELDSLKEKLQMAREGYKQRQKLDQERQEISHRVEQLTPREREVMDRMVEGFKNTEIALRLGISRKTLDIHRLKVVDKMKARTPSDLVRWKFLYESGPDGRVVIKPESYLG